VTRSTLADLHTLKQKTGSSTSTYDEDQSLPKDADKESDRLSPDVREMGVLFVPTHSLFNR